MMVVRGNMVNLDDPMKVWRVLVCAAGSKSGHKTASQVPGRGQGKAPAREGTGESLATTGDHWSRHLGPAS